MNQMFFGNSRVMLFTPNGGSAVDLTKTRFTLQDGTVEEWPITGVLDNNWLVEHGYEEYDEQHSVYSITDKNIISIVVGNTVTSFGNEVFKGTNIQNITLPANMDYIPSGIFDREACTNTLTSLIFNCTSVPTIIDSAFEEKTNLNLTFNNIASTDVLSQINRNIFGSSTDFTTTFTFSDKTVRISIDGIGNWEIKEFTDWEFSSITPLEASEYVYAASFVPQWTIYDESDDTYKFEIDIYIGANTQHLETYANKNSTTITCQCEVDDYDSPLYGQTLAFTWTRHRL